MKNRLSLILLFASCCCSLHLFAQEVVKPPKKNFLAIDIAPLVGIELKSSIYSSTFAAMVKRQINQKYRLRAHFANARRGVNFGRVLHVFNDTILNFDHRSTYKMKFQSGVGLERTKRFGICEVYYGLQMHCGLEERDFNSTMGDNFGPHLEDQLAYISSTTIRPYYSDFVEGDYSIITRSQSKFMKFGLGVPLGFGVDIIKHIGLQVEITPGVQLTRSLEVFEYLTQPTKKEVEHTTINMDYVGFNVFLGWRF